MKKRSLALLVITCTIFGIRAVYGQTENYKKGLKAMQANQYHQAMMSFGKVVADEKFEITGKDLSMAYAYLAIIRTAYLEKSLQADQFASINSNQGQIQLAIEEMARAVRFQNNSSKSIINTSRERLEVLTRAAVKTLGDSLMTYNGDLPGPTSVYLSDLIIKQFGELTELVNHDWLLFDVLGLAHYHLGDKEKAMPLFKQSREIFTSLEVQPNSQLHLINYVLSGNYFFEEVSNKKEAYQISDEGSAYTSTLINGLSDSQMKDILRLNKIENRFRMYMARIDDSGE